MVWSNLASQFRDEAQLRILHFSSGDRSQVNTYLSRTLPNVTPVDTGHRCVGGDTHGAGQTVMAHQRSSPGGN